MAGCVDVVDDQRIAGWSPEPAVVVSVNGEDRASPICQEPRPDVLAHGFVTEDRVGFSSTLSLADGDVVRVRTATGDRALHHSPWLYSTGDGWLDPALAKTNAEYSYLAPLHSETGFRRFRPLFGHGGEVVAASLEFPDGQRWVARWGLSPDQIIDIQTIHERLLDPACLPVPALGTVVEKDGRSVLFFEDAGWMPLDKLSTDWDSLLIETMAAVARLHKLGDGQRAVLASRASRRRHPVARLAARSLRALLTRQRSLGERRTVLAMVATIPRLPRVLSHGDLHRKNVLIAESGQPRLVDWDCWDYLPAGYDPAMLLRGLPAERIERLVDAIEWPLPHETRLGLVLFTYLQQTLDNPSLHSSEEGRYLRERFRSLLKSQPIRPWFGH